MCEKPFWMVYNLSSQGECPPTVTHTSESSARIEAARLAAKIPGDSFVVLQAISRYTTTQPVIHIDYK